MSVFETGTVLEINDYRLLENDAVRSTKNNRTELSLLFEKLRPMSVFSQHRNEHFLFLLLRQRTFWNVEIDSGARHRQTATARRGYC